MESRKHQNGYRVFYLFSVHEGEDEVPPEPCENSFRILSWNLDGLSVEKARNPGVVDVVGKLLSRYHIKVAVIEGIKDPLGLKEVSVA